MSEPIVEPPPGNTGTVAPPAPQQAAEPPAPTTKPDGWTAPNPFADKKVGGSGNLDYADPDD